VAEKAVPRVAQGTPKEKGCGLVHDNNERVHRRLSHPEIHSIPRIVFG
jgi:hypothetical protein